MCGFACFSQSNGEESGSDSEPGELGGVSLGDKGGVKGAASSSSSSEDERPASSSSEFTGTSKCVTLLERGGARARVLVVFALPF